MTLYMRRDTYRRNAILNHYSSGPDSVSNPGLNQVAAVSSMLLTHLWTRWTRHNEQGAIFKYGNDQYDEKLLFA
jgi:hypothetical protein